jgi:hypothetical protein
VAVEVLMSGSPMQQPSAWIPIAMSLAALAMTLSYVAIVGVAAAHQPDEGAVAHMFQVLMAGQMPFIAFFAVKWLLRAPRQALQVLALQAGAALAALAPVYWLGL